MNFWTAAVIVFAIWGLVQIYTRRHDRELGVTRDEDGNPVFAPRDDSRSSAELTAARRDLEDLRQRVRVLERIVTDGNSSDARERARIAAEIEALRLPDRTASKQEDQAQ